MVIPAFQEEALLPVTLSALPSSLHCVVIVDDASQDQTRVKALEFARHSLDHNGPLVRVLSLETNSGVGRAICIGYLEAYTLGADVAVVMGADAQMDADELPHLVRALGDELAYVKGERMTHPEVRLRMPKLRYYGNQILSWMTGRLVGDQQLCDAQCGYTALKLSWLPRLPIAELYPRYGFPNDFLFRIHEAGGRFAQVPVTPIYGDERSKLSIPKVIMPILALFLRALCRRFFLKLINLYKNQ